MKEMINKSLEFWNNYWGGSLFPWLLAASVLYLLIFKTGPLCPGICLCDIVFVLFSVYGKDHTEMCR